MVESTNKTNSGNNRNDINHKDGPACFRSHDALHKTADGKGKIESSDCNSCNTILAQDDAEQLTKLNPKGHNFVHIDPSTKILTAITAHTGGFPSNRVKSFKDNKELVTRKKAF